MLTSQTQSIKFCLSPTLLVQEMTKKKDFNFAQSRETFLNGRFESNARGVKFATAKGEIKRLNAEIRRVMAEQLAIYEWSRRSRLCKVYLQMKKEVSRYVRLRS